MWTFAKRVVLFVATSYLISLTLSTVLNLLGVQPYLTANGIDYQSLIIFCLAWGMIGAFISLLLSKPMAKWMVGVKVIDPARPGQYADLYNLVQNISRAAHLAKVPEVGVYESDELNAFATGATKNSSLVAVSTGLLQRMNRDELEGVLAHEISHITNGDMVTMTLLQGIMNAIVMFLARVIAFAISQNVKEESRYWVRWISVFVLEIAFSLLGMLIVMGFSRYREYHADAGSAKLVGSNKMIAALEAIKRYRDQILVDKSNPSLATLKINGAKNWLTPFASHPALEDRIKALQTGAYRA